jgi:hypothetical protein
MSKQYNLDEIPSFQLFLRRDDFRFFSENIGKIANGKKEFSGFKRVQLRL